MPVQITYPGVYIEELPGGPRTIPGVATSITAFVGRALKGPVNEPVRIHSFGDFERIFGGLWRSSPMSYAVQQYYLNSGREALIVRVHNRAGQGVDVTDRNVLTDADILGTQPAKTGIYALEKADLFNLLCIPPLDFATDPNPAVTLAPALKYCKDRRAMLIVDPPNTWLTKDDAKNNIDALIARDANAAVYFPRLRLPDPLQRNRLDVFVPCGAVCGVIARTDAKGGVWKAPAGLDATIAGVRELTCNLPTTNWASLTRWH